jgi:superfamily I DNA/RNA helicase/RecB family exonuclease
MTVEAPPATARIIDGPEAWDAALDDFRRPQLVVGGPGTGKTEFLVQRALRLLRAHLAPAPAVTVLGFSRRGVAELTDRVRSAASGPLPSLDVATFHSYAARLLEHDPTAAGWRANPQLLTGPEQVALVRELLAAEDPTAWSAAFGPLLGSATFAAEVTEFILRAAEQMHTARSLRALNRPSWRGLADFVATYQRTLRRQGRIDYGTLIGATVEAIERRRTAIDPPAEAYLLVDEYQDTTPAQVRLLQALQARGHHITAAADPSQSIYGFRGASVANVAAFENDFCRTGADPVRITLTTSFRTPAAILDAAAAVTAPRLPAATGTIAAAGRGSVETYVFDQQVEEAEWIAAEVHRLHLVESIPYRAIGVFVRSKHRLLGDLSRSLDRRRVPHDLPGSRLADQPAVRFVFDLIAAATGCDGLLEADRAIRRVLLGPRVGLPPGAVREIEQQQRTTGSWTAALRTIRPEWSTLADLLDDSSWAEHLAAADGLWHLWTRLPGLDEMVTDPAGSEERAAWRSLSQVTTRWGERNPGATLVDYRRLAAAAEFEAEPLLSYRCATDDRLVLTTLHQAKGVELDTVFIADAVDGVFPDLRSRDSLLGVRHLLADVPTEAAAYRTFRLQEESRLAYTAMTRARRRVVWTATQRHLDDGPGRPSRFLTAVAAAMGTTAGRPRDNVTIDPGAAARPGSRLPVTPQEAEAALRRWVGDPAVPAPRRLAALDALARGTRWGMGDPAGFAGVAERGSDTGLLPTEPVATPSQAQLYETCPRRYALERLLRIGAAGTPHARFGSLIHDVLEVVEGDAIASGRAHGSLAAARSELAARFDPAGFGGEPYAAAWLERAEECLAELYHNWPSPDRRGISVEHRLEMTCGGLRWIGRADRIETDGDGIAIVDYKTGRSPVTRAEAAASLQLGFYALAASRDEITSRHGPVRGAELWYPLANSAGVTRRELVLSRLDEIEERLEAIGRGILAEDWRPRPGPHCERCPQRPICPVWTEGSIG